MSGTICFVLNAKYSKRIGATGLAKDDERRDMVQRKAPMIPLRSQQELNPNVNEYAVQLHRLHDYQCILLVAIVLCYINLVRRTLGSHLKAFFHTDTLILGHTFTHASEQWNETKCN
jgi:hypothetical protein